MLQMFDIRFLISNNEFQMPEFRIHLAECWFSGLRFQIPDCVFSYSPGHICDYQFWRYYFMYQILEFWHEIGQPGNKLNFRFFCRPPPSPISKLICVCPGRLWGKDVRLSVGVHLPNIVFWGGGGLRAAIRSKSSDSTGVWNPESGIRNRESGNGNRESGFYRFEASGLKFEIWSLKFEGCSLEFDFEVWSCFLEFKIWSSKC